MKREQDKRKPKRQEPSMMTDPLTICTHILPLRDGENMWRAGRDLDPQAFTCSWRKVES